MSHSKRHWHDLDTPDYHLMTSDDDLEDDHSESSSLLPRQHQHNAYNALDNDDTATSSTASLSPGQETPSKSLGVFGPEIRSYLTQILLSSWMETIFLLMLLSHCTILLVVGRGTDPNPEPAARWGQSWDQYALLGIFCFYTVHVLTRIVAFGFLFSTPSNMAFMRHSWNRVDLVSVISYWIDVWLTCTGMVITEQQRILAFRALSTLILFRLLLATQSCRIILQSLKKAGPLLVTVTSFVLFFSIILAIVGVQSFKGSYLRKCVWQDPNDPSNYQVMQQYCGGYMQNGTEQPYLLLDGVTPGRWAKGFTCQEGLVCRETENPFGDTLSFDNIFGSMLIVTITAGSQTWTEPMYDMMDAEYVFASIYFILIVFIMNFWLMNLFVAVINEMFAKVRQESKRSAFTTTSTTPVLTESQEEGWTIYGGIPSNSNDTFLRDLCRFTRPLWLLAIAADLIVMGWKNNDMSPEQLEIIDQAELGFTLAFLVEISLRFASYWPQWRRFLRYKRNQVDLFIAIITCAMRLPYIHNNHFLYSWLTGFQILRIYRLVVAIPGLRRLSARVVGSAWNLITLVGFIILATTVVAIMAFELLEGAMNDSDDEMRFFSIYNSFVGLNQLFSGEDWTTVLYGAMEAGSTNKSAVIHALFLVVWFLSSNSILVNMFTAVLMENFEIDEEEKRALQVKEYVDQREHRINHDPVVSKWNVYRYFKPHPKQLSVYDLPPDLTLRTQRTMVSDFMHGSQADMENGNGSNTQLLMSPVRDDGIMGRIRRFFLFPFQPKRQPSLTATAIEYHNPIQQFQANYYGPQHQAFSLSRLLVRKDTTAASLAETLMQQSEERQRQRWEFIASHPTYDKPLYIFSRQNRFRRWCQSLVPPSRGERFNGQHPSLLASWIFYCIIGAAIITTVVMTIYDSPVYRFYYAKSGSDFDIFRIMDWVFTVIFTIEFVVKVVADGFLFTPNAYLLNGWHVLDLIILVTLYMSNLYEFAASTGVERGFRALKALRALRLINLLKPARDMFTVIMVKGLLCVVDAAFLCLFLVVPFALYGQNVFQGLFYECNDDGAPNKTSCIHETMLGVEAPLPDGTAILAPRIWENPYVYSFDSFWKGLLVLVEIASGEGWIDVLQRAMGLAGKDLNSVRDSSQWTGGVFFMVYNLVGSVMVISLFVGIVLENFARRSGTAYLTAEQRRWLDLKKQLKRMRPPKRPKRLPTTELRKWCYRRVVNKKGHFYQWMKVVIVLNILFLCTEFYHDDQFTNIRLYTYMGFLIVYWFEMAVKIFALGWPSYSRSWWNMYDLVMVLGCTATLIMRSQRIAVETQKLFMTALCFKLVPRSDSLNELFTIMAASASEIVNSFGVWFIIMTTYAIMFMQVFGLTKYGTQATTEHLNFRSYTNAMISLVRFSTGEEWNTVMHDYAVSYPECVMAPDYLGSDCGSSGWAYILFLSFNIISMYIFTAVFTGVVSDNFSYVYQIASNYSLVSREQIRKFKKVWADIDLERTGSINECDYMRFWRRLEGNFKVRIYEPEFSYKRLARQYVIWDRRSSSSSSSPYEVRVDLDALAIKLDELDPKELHHRKHVLDSLYWEAAVIQASKGDVSFNDMLLMIARRKLVVPEEAFQLDELLRYRNREEVVQTLIKINRVKCMLETYALRKKFLRWRQRDRPVEFDRRYSRPQNIMAQYNVPAGSLPTSPTSPGGHSNDGCGDATQESRERDLWQDTHIGIIVELLQDELE